MKTHRHLILIPALLLLAATLILPVSAEPGRPSQNDINRAARIAKAHALRDLSATTFTTDRLSSTFPARRSAELAPNDTMVRLWANMVRIFGLKPDSALFDDQAALLANYPQASTDYYMQLINMATKPSVNRLRQGYEVALEAARTAPDDERLGWLTLSYGIALLQYDAGVGDNDSTARITEQYRPRATQLVHMADSLMALHGTQLQAQMNKAKVLLMLGDTLGLEQTAEQLLTRDANDPETLNAVTRIYYAIGDHDRVADLGIRSFELEPDAHELYNLFGAITNHEDTLRLQEAVINVAANPSLEPEVRAEALDAAIYATFEYLNEYADGDGLRGKFHQRVDSVAREIIADEPDNYELAMTLAKLGRSANWVIEYGGHYLTDYGRRYPEADTLNTRSASLLTSAGYIADDFAPLINNLIAHQPKQPSYYHLKAMWMGRNDRNLEGAALLDSINYSMIIDAYREANPDKGETEVTAEAKKLWTSTLNLQADMYFAGGNKRKAIGGYRRALSVDPNNAGVLNNLAYISATEGGDLNEALELANRSLEADPDNLNTIDTRAWILFLMGRYDEALVDMTRYFDKSQIDIALFSKPNELFTVFGSVLRSNFGDNITVDSLSADDYADISQAIFSRNEGQTAQPILVHLLAIYDALGLNSEAASVARFVAKAADEEPQVKTYLDKHPDYLSLLK